MLIRSVRAENFKKFSLLHLTNIPRQGLIGIEGPNESGKSSLGDAILFAFFGKLSADDPFEISRLIRWGADSLTVEVEFSVDSSGSSGGSFSASSRGDYRIFRQIDRGGTNYVKVVRADGQDAVATGHVEVEAFVSRTLKIELEDVWESIYLGQSASGDAGVPTAAFLARLAGTAQIREAVASLESEIVHLEREYANYQKDVGRNQDQIDKMNRSLSRMADLRGKVDKISESLAFLEQKEKSQSKSQGIAKKLCENFKRGAEQFDGASERTVDKISKCLDRELQKYEMVEANDQRLSRVFKSVEKHRSRLVDQKQKIESLRRFSNEFDELRGHFEGLGEEYRTLLDPESEDSLAREKSDADHRLVRLNRTRRRSGTFVFVLLIMAVIFGAAGGFLAAGSSHAEPFLGQIRDVGLDPRTVWLALLGMAGVNLLVAIGFLTRYVRTAEQLRQSADLGAQYNNRIEETQTRQKKLQDLLGSSSAHEVGEFVRITRELGDSARDGYLTAFEQDHGKLFNGSGDSGYRKVLRNLAAGERQVREDLQKEIQSAGKAFRDLGHEVKSKQSELDRSRSEVREAENLIPRKESLVAKNEDLEAGAAEVARELDQRRAAIELLLETERAIVGRIGPNVSRSVRGVLPALTDNRYRDLKLDEDLIVRLFTSEKCDFVELHEISGGTLEALKLAFRLATSHVLSSSRLRQKQFLFLDEPFRLMDAERAVHAIGLLPVLSPFLSQFFVVRTSFTAAETGLLDRLVFTGVQNGELVADLGQPIEGVLENPARDVLRSS